MTRENKADSLKQQWWAALEAQGAPAPGLDAAPAAGLPVDGDFRLIPGLGLVCLRVCETPPGEWAIARHVLEGLETLKGETGTAWWLVLLVARVSGEGAQGYILNGLASPPIKNPPRWEEDVLTIRERRHLDSTRMILSIEKLAAILMRHHQG